MRTFFKGIKKLIVLILVIIIFVVGYFVKDGYDLYRAAIEEKSLEMRVKELKEMDNYTKLEDISKYYLDGLIAVEDKRFYEHHGIDPYAIGGAVVYTFQAQNIGFGASTLSQQLAKNLVLDQRRKLVRKIAEIFATIDIEKNYSKDEILEMYANISYFGDGYYGIGNASKGYFGKEPKELDLNEATLLVGLPNAPSVYQLSNNNDGTYLRQIKVIQSMIKNGTLDQNEGDALIEKIKNERGI